MVLLRLANQKYPVLPKFDKKISSVNATIHKTIPISRQVPNRTGKREDCNIACCSQAQKQMKTLYLHIGQAKTGTTAIQNYCSKNENLLSKLGLRYVGLGREAIRKNHRIIHYSLLSASGGRPRDRDSQTIPFPVLLESLKSEIEARPENTFLISFEGLAALPEHTPKSARILNQFKKHIRPLCDIRILYYVRDPLSLLISNYNERSKKTGWVGPFLDFAMDAPDHTYDQTVSYRFYASVFGGRNVIVKHYGDLKGPDFIRDFVLTMGIRVGTIEDIEPANPGLPENELEPSRIRTCLTIRNKPSEKTRFLFGRLDSSHSKWAAYEKRLARINTNNKEFFRKHVGVSVAPIQITDIIHTERRLNHNALVLHYIRSNPDLNKLWNETSAQI